jgi:hypothetical protein
VRAPARSRRRPFDPNRDPPASRRGAVAQCVDHGSTRSLRRLDRTWSPWRRRHPGLRQSVWMSDSDRALGPAWDAGAARDVTPGQRPRLLSHLGAGLADSRDRRDACCSGCTPCSSGRAHERPPDPRSRGLVQAAARLSSASTSACARPLADPQRLDDYRLDLPIGELARGGRSDPVGNHPPSARWLGVQPLSYQGSSMRHRRRRHAVTPDRGRTHVVGTRCGRRRSRSRGRLPAPPLPPGSRADRAA